MKNQLTRILFLAFIIVIGIQSSCKKKETQESISGTYELKRHGYSYWCDGYLSHNGGDSIVLYGPYAYRDQPSDEEVLTVVINGSKDAGYSVCMDSKGGCADSLFISNLTFPGDSVDFGKHFRVKLPEYSMIKMRGIKTSRGFSGYYTEYYNQTVPTSSEPYDHVFIGTFELVKK